MSGLLPIVYLARHGETAWSLSGQHTGLTDLPLTERGESDASALKLRLKIMTFSKVFTSPLKRAVRTCELAGFGDRSEIDPDLVEWNYGEYEGVRTAEIRERRPNWQFVTVVPAANPSKKSGHERTASWPGFDRSTKACCCFPADIFCVCWRHVG